MGKVSFIFRTDVHVADQSPVSWKGDYPSEIWSNLEQIGEFARKYQVTAVLDGGDYFHVKAPTKNSHALVARSAAIHAAYPCPTWCIEGNHDVKHNNLDTIDGQPLGVLFESGAFKHLREQVFKEGDVQVRVVGMPYSPVRELSELQAIRKQPGDTHLVAIVHALASENPPSHVDDFFGEPVFRYSDLIVEGGPDVWCFGHWHRDQGVVDIQGRRFVNQGAVSRGALIRENLQRTPKVALLEFGEEGFEVSSIPLKVAPAAEVFDIERKERLEKERRSIDQFVERLKADIAIDPSDGIEGSIQALDFAQDIKTLALGYLERAREGR